MSVDTDVWVAALLVYAAHQSTRNVRIVVRQQRGLVRPGEFVRHIDALDLFNGLINLDWPHGFSSMQRCLPVIAAYALCGTDFSPTLHSFTSHSIFNSYFCTLKNAEVHDFVKPLGDHSDGGSEACALNWEKDGCVKFICLA